MTNTESVSTEMLLDIESVNVMPFSQDDKIILRSYEAVVDGIASLIGPFCEIVLHSLEDLKVKPTIVSRKPSSNTILYEEINKNIIQDNTIIINCTPVGTFPKVNECPNIPYKYISKNHLCYDLIYNPIKTKFLIKSEKAGAGIINGKKMLENQANESWRIWNS